MENTRTIKQNDYLHFLFGLIRDALRNKGFDEVKTKEDAKVVCKRLFKIERTSTLSTKEFSEFVEGLQWWAAEFLDTYLPDPDEEPNYFNQKENKAA